jgi:serine/threonine protein kinase
MSTTNSITNYCIRNLFPLDLKPYGIQLVLTNDTTLDEIRRAKLNNLDKEESYIPPEYNTPELENSPFKYVYQKKKITIGTEIYTEQSSIGSGSGGSVYKCLNSKNESVALKIIPDKRPINKGDIIVECVLQILLYEGSKGSETGPYVPKFYSVVGGGSQRDRSMTHSAWYIITEYMDSTLTGLCKDKPAEETEPILIDALQQVLPMLSWLESIHFNHRDFGGTNLMVKTSETGNQYKLIDFGASCLEIPTLSRTILPIAVSPFHDFTKCFKKGRDLAHLLWDIVTQYNITDRLRALCMNQLKIINKGVNKSNNIPKLTMSRHSILNSDEYLFPNLNIETFTEALQASYPSFRIIPTLSMEEPDVENYSPSCIGRVCKRVTNTGRSFLSRFGYGGKRTRQYKHRKIVKRTRKGKKYSLPKSSPLHNRR